MQPLMPAAVLLGVPPCHLDLTCLGCRMAADEESGCSVAFFSVFNEQGGIGVNLQVRLSAPYAPCIMIVAQPCRLDAVWCGAYIGDERRDIPAVPVSLRPRLACSREH